MLNTIQINLSMFDIMWHANIVLNHAKMNMIRVGKYCKFINVCEGFIWQNSRSSCLNSKNKYPQT